jgi:tRNA dimethylallyltransferase
LQSDKKNLLLILGPTAVGKSRLALTLAKAFNGEIINCDSMQVYRGFDIGTDKLSPDQRGDIPHHLLDIVRPEHQFTAAEFLDRAAEAAGDIILRQKLPLCTGGTGLYMTALVKGLFPGAGRDERIRKELAEEVDKTGLEPLFDRLKSLDPDYAAKIGAKDRIRILRALEVYALTSRSMTDNFALTRSSFEEYNKILIGLHMERSRLYARIEERVERMYAGGLVEETKSLLEQGIPSSAPPFRALGYKQVIRYLHDEVTLEEAVEETKRETRHYAKRQMTWFRKMEGINWFTAEGTAEISAFVKERLSLSL